MAYLVKMHFVLRLGAGRSERLIPGDLLKIKDDLLWIYGLRYRWVKTPVPASWLIDRLERTAEEHPDCMEFIADEDAFR